jgi:dTDP-4-dehydrorhamnose reductase
MRTLVFGGGGWVGQTLVRALVDAGHQVIAPSHRTCDVASQADVRRAFAEARPDAVINAAALTTRTTDEAALYAVNLDGARNVAVAAARVGARLVHVSTDMVLDGKAPPYGDDARANPVNAYGRSKAAGEAAVRTACASAVVVRPSHVFDPATPDPTLRGFIDRLEKGEPCRLYTDEIRCPIARPTLCAALVELLTLDVSGTLNVAGPEPLTRFEYGTLLLEHFRVPLRDRVEPALAARAAEPRPLDLTLDVSKAKSLLETPILGVGETLRAREA